LAPHNFVTRRSGLTVDFSGRAIAEIELAAEYYDNASLSGAPRLSIYEAALNHDWGNGSPAVEIPPDNFSARAIPSPAILKKGPTSSCYPLTMAREVWLDGNLILDAWDFGYKTRKAKFTLTLPATTNCKWPILKNRPGSD